MESNSQVEEQVDSARTSAFIARVAVGAATFLGAEAIVQDMGLDRPVAATVAGLATLVVETAPFFHSR